jgi:Tfp pilus assembly protein PilV
MPTRGTTRPPLARLKSSAGFGLTEVIVSVVISGTALMGIAGTANRVGSALNKTHENARALVVAQNQLESLLTQPFDELQGGMTVSDGVWLSWRVTAADHSKEIALTYRYQERGVTHTRWLTAGRLGS